MPAIDWASNPYFIGGLDPGHLGLILFPTGQCNFRCSYCYEDFTEGRMAPAVIAGLKSLLSRRAPDLTSLSISWFGGEPLAARDVVFDLLHHVADIRRLYPALRFHGWMTTNGWSLDPATAARLTALGSSSYQITLDGAAGEHDRTRRRANGGDSFAQIWRNLVGLLNSDIDFRILLRLHLHRGNGKSLTELIDSLNARFAGDPRFAAYVHPVEKLGGDTKFPYFSDHAEEAEAKTAATALLDPRLRHDDPHADAYVCYASRPNTFGIRPDGSVVKCTVALKDARNTIGQLADGRLRIDQARHQIWLRGLETLDPETLACPWRHL